MNVIQNYLVTIMHGNFSLYEVRLFSRIVLHANHVIKGKRVSPLLGRSLGADGITAHLAIPISDIITDNAHDYTAVIAAAKNLQDKVVEFYDRRERKWTFYRDHLINNVVYKQGSGIIRFDVSVWLLNYILDFINGNFSLYDFEKCLELTSAYAVRWYWLTCSMKNPVNYKLDMLRDMFGTGDKYKQNKDFIKRCVIVPMKMLEEHKMNGFTFEKKGRGHNSFLHITPVKRQEPSRQQLVAMASISAWCAPEVKNYLLTAGGFDNDALHKNKVTLFEFCQIPSYADIVVRIVRNARKGRAGIGYIINAMKSEVAKYKRRKGIIKTLPFEKS